MPAGGWCRSWASAANAAVAADAHASPPGPRWNRCAGMRVTGLGGDAVLGPPEGHDPREPMAHRVRPARRHDAPRGAADGTRVPHRRRLVARDRGRLDASRRTDARRRRRDVRPGGPSSPGDHRGRRQRGAGVQGARDEPRRPGGRRGADRLRRPRNRALLRLRRALRRRRPARPRRRELRLRRAVPAGGPRVRGRDDPAAGLPRARRCDLLPGPVAAVEPRLWRPHRPRRDVHVPPGNRSEGRVERGGAIPCDRAARLRRPRARTGAAALHGRDRPAATARHSPGSTGRGSRPASRTPCRSPTRRRT